MPYSLRLKGFFLGCVIGTAASVRMAFAGSVGLFGAMGGLASYANELSILIAILAASRLTKRLNNFYARRTELRLLEEGFLKWASELEARKAAAAEVSTPDQRKAA